MRAFFQSLKRWYQRRFRGFVAAPARSHGTSWQQWPRDRATVLCRCGFTVHFSQDDYVIREQEHDEDCELQYEMQPVKRCACPVLDARYVKICPQCGLGHWTDATPKGPSK